MAVESPDSDFHEPAPPAARGILPILWQRKALIILGLVLGLGGGFLFYWQRQPVYQATALVLVIKKTSQPLSGPGGPAVNPHLQYFEDYMPTHVVIMRSPMIIDRAIKKKDLTALKTFEDAPDPVGLILNGLAVSRDSKEVTGANNILFMSFRGPVADECGKILTAIIESYQEFMDITYRDVSVQTLDGITKARELLRKDVAESEEKYERFRQGTQGSFIRSKEGNNIAFERVANIETKRSALLIRGGELQEQIKFLENGIGEGKGTESLAALMRSAGDAKVLAAEKVLDEQLLPLKLLEVQLVETNGFGEDHPQVRSVRRRIEMLKEHYSKKESIGAGATNDPVKLHLASLHGEKDDTEMKLKALDSLLAGMKGEARNLSNLEMQEDTLRRDIERTRQLYQETINQLKKIEVMRDQNGGFDAKQLSQSGVGIKVAPSAFQTIMGGAMVGLLLGIGLAFLADFTDKGFRSPDEVRLRLRLPVLGHVPFLKPDPEVARKAETGEIQADPLLYALYKSKSMEAEAYRAIRTALLFSIQGEGHRVIQVTSPNKADGKSLMTANLAISIAQSNKKVLLIDADCRRPRQHKIFNLSNTLGLVNAVCQDAPWQECVQPTPAPGLYVMASGPIPPNPAELLTSPQFKPLLDQARQEFDIVLIDSPPLLAVTDPSIVAGRVDGVILVLRLSRHGRPQAERACEIMKSLKVNVFGIVVNGVTRQEGGGIYSAGHYDYTESYTDNDAAGSFDESYYDDESKHDAVPVPQAPKTESKPGFLSRIFSRRS